MCSRASARAGIWRSAFSDACSSAQSAGALLRMMSLACQNVATLDVRLAWEKKRLLKLAAARPESDTARLAATLALNTAMRGCEIKGRQWREVDLVDRTITIHRSKTEAGERVIPLNADGWAVILSLERRRESFSVTTWSLTGTCSRTPRDSQSPTPPNP